MAREHHFFFAKKLIPTETFRSADQMFAELTGAQREAFVFFLWTEAGKQCSEKLPHVGLAPGGLEMAKLNVVGRIKSGETEVVVVSMPPALETNEAMFLGLVRGTGGRLSVFFYERCLDAAGTGVHATEAVLAEARADGSRVNHGFKPGLDLAAFKGHLGGVLGISLDGLETSLPPVTAEAFVAAGGGKGEGKAAGLNPYLSGAGAGAAGAGAGAGAAGTSAGAKPGGLLETLLLVRFGLPLVLYVLGNVAGGLLFPLWPYIGPLYMLLSGVIGIALLVWLYQVYAARPGKTPFGPGMAIAGWLIPGLNFVMPPLIVRGAWKAVMGAGGGLLALVWWVFYLLEIVKQLQMSMLQQGNSLPLPREVQEIVMMTLQWPWSMAVTIGAYGLLWYIVRTVRAKM